MGVGFKAKYPKNRLEPGPVSYMSNLSNSPEHPEQDSSHRYVGLPSRCYESYMKHA